MIKLTTISGNKCLINENEVFEFILAKDNRDVYTDDWTVIAYKPTNPDKVIYRLVKETPEEIYDIIENKNKKDNNKNIGFL